MTTKHIANRSVVFVPVLVLLHFGATRGLGNDDLVYSQNCDGSL